MQGAVRGILFNESRYILETRTHGPADIHHDFRKASSPYVLPDGQFGNTSQAIDAKASLLHTLIPPYVSCRFPCRLL